MHKKIELLLAHRVSLNVRKFELVQQLHGNKLQSLRTWGAIHLVINRELYVNNKLLKILATTKWPTDIKKEFVGPITAHLKKIVKVLDQENKILYQVNLLNVKVLGKRDDFARNVRGFKKLCDREVDLNAIFIHISQKLPQKYQIDQEELKEQWQLIVQLQNEVHALATNIGNAAVVRKQGEHILKHIAKVQETEMYEFVQKDILYVKEKVTYVMQHPKEHKVAYVLTTIYIVAPFTFEATAAILFFRYLGKYTVSKTKKLHQKFTAKA